jgi:hypothetical protein
VVDVGGAIDHRDHGDHGLQPVGRLHLAAEGRLGALFHKEKKSVVVFFLAVRNLYFSVFSIKVSRILLSRK